MIHFYELSSMDSAQRARLVRRAEIRIDELVERIRPIVEDVRNHARGNLCKPLLKRYAISARSTSARCRMSNGLQRLPLA